MREEQPDSFAELERVLAEMEELTAANARAEARRRNSVRVRINGGRGHFSETEDVWIKRPDINDNYIWKQPLLENAQLFAKRRRADKLKEKRKTTLAPLHERPFNSESGAYSSHKNPSRRHTVALNGNYVKYDDPADQLTLLRKQQIAEFYGTHSSTSETKFNGRMISSDDSCLECSYNYGRSSQKHSSTQRYGPPSKAMHISFDSFVYDRYYNDGIFHSA